MINRRFQVYVTPDRCDKNTRFAIKSVFAVGLIFFLLIFILVAVIHLKKKENNFLPLSFYFVYSSKYRKESMLYTEKETLKKSGGACEIYFHKNYYYMFVSVYFEKNEADEFADSIKEMFPNVGVLRITTSKFSKTAKSQILGYFEVKNALKYVKSDFGEVLEIQNNYVLEKIDSGSVISTLSRHKLNLQTLEKRLIDSAGKMGVLLSSYIEMELLAYNEFFEKFYVQSSNRVHLLSKLATKLAIIQIKMINNLSI